MEKQENSSQNWDLFKKSLLMISKMDKPMPIYVENCNNIRIILEKCLEVAGVNKTHSVYYHPNLFFYMDLELTEITTFDHYKAKFKAYTDYFDRYKYSQILYGIKKLYNYSNNQTREIYSEYPNDVNMILVVENFNFYDLNSQYIIHELSKDHKNILVVAQIRTDFDFAEKHIDISIKAGGGLFVDLLK